MVDNSNGHIHSSTGCSTVFRWVTSLSGQTEAVLAAAEKRAKARR